MSMEISSEKILVKANVNLSKTMDSSFSSMKDIYSTNHIYYISNTTSRRDGESIGYGHFVAYIFDWEKCCTYSENKINYVKTKLVLEYEEFQKKFTNLVLFANL